MRKKQKQLDWIVPLGKEPVAYGNPVWAFRVDEETLAAFVAHHGGREKAIAATKAWMARAVRK